MEANLKQKYSNDQIESFYAGFKDNLPAYKKINPEVVETLFGFIDFESFKKGILLAKNFENENFEKDMRTKVDAPMTDVIDLKYL